MVMVDVFMGLMASEGCGDKVNIIKTFVVISKDVVVGNDGLGVCIVDKSLGCWQ